LRSCKRGFPIYDERDGHRGLWKVEQASATALPIPLSLPEIVALLVTRDLLDHGAGAAVSVASAFAKIQALDTARSRSSVRAGAWGPTIGAKLQLGPASTSRRSITLAERGRFACATAEPRRGDGPARRPITSRS
jgi:hypothetical protein